MSDPQNDPGHPDNVRQRAEQGKDILGATVARGEPGEKQPQHPNSAISTKETLDILDKTQGQLETQTYESSEARAKKPGNLNPIPPEERTASRGDQVLQAANTAAAAIGSARDAITRQLESDARITSDPRYERDQKVYELGAAGKLGQVEPSEAEKAAQLARSGTPPEVAEKLPASTEEQVADDMRRLEKAEKAEKAPANVVATHIQPGEQDITPKNNGLTAEQEGKTGEAAVARAKAHEGTPIK